MPLMGRQFGADRPEANVVTEFHARSVEVLPQFSRLLSTFASGLFGETHRQDNADVKLVYVKDSKIDIFVYFRINWTKLPLSFTARFVDAHLGYNGLLSSKT